MDKPRLSSRCPVTWSRLQTPRRSDRSPRLRLRTACGLLLLAGWIPAQTAWTDRTPASSPPGRLGPGLAYDSARGRTVLFGGLNGGQATFSDTWEWDGS